MRWELWTLVYLLEDRTHQERNYQKVKTQVQQKNPHKQKKGKPRVSRDGDQRHDNTESLIIPPLKFTIQRHLVKWNIRKCRNKQKDILKAGKQRESLQSKGMEDSPLKELNEMEVSKLSGIEFKVWCYDLYLSLLPTLNLFLCMV